jgi:hypothetical protein
LKGGVLAREHCTESRTKAKNLGMGGLSRERETALTGGAAAERRLLSIQFRACLALDQESLKRGGHWAKAQYGCEGIDHEEVKAQEGKASCQDTNYGLTMRSIFTRTKALKTTKDVERSFS